MVEEKKRGRKGIRYSDEQKREVLEWLQDNPGRGSLKKAQEKFKISYIALRSWMGESTSPGKAVRIKEKASKIGSGDFNKYDELKSLVEDIGAREKELKVLYAKVNKLLTT